MLTIEKREAKHQIKCSCCGSTVRTCEKYLQVLNDDSPVRGERYCIHCETEAYENNPDIGMAPESTAERRREEFAAYQAAGCPSTYFDDQQAGYIR
jgi:hypothetical protein